MECDFQVGDAVVCVEEFSVMDALIAGCRGPILDEIYHIRRVFDGEPCKNCGKVHQPGVFVYLDEIKMFWGDTQSEIGMSHTMFRKLLTVDDFKSEDAKDPVTPHPQDPNVPKVREPEHAD